MDWAERQSGRAAERDNARCAEQSHSEHFIKWCATIKPLKITCHPSHIGSRIKPPPLIQAAGQLAGHHSARFARSISTWLMPHGCLALVIDKSSCKEYN